MRDCHTHHTHHTHHTYHTYYTYHIDHTYHTYHTYHIYFTRLPYLPYTYAVPAYPYAGRLRSLSSIRSRAVWRFTRGRTTTRRASRLRSKGAPTYSLSCTCQAITRYAKHGKYGHYGRRSRALTSSKTATLTMRDTLTIGNILTILTQKTSCCGSPGIARLISRFVAPLHRRSCHARTGMDRHSTSYWRR
mgnify:CR=1 FL=1